MAEMYRVFYWMSVSLAAAWMVFALYEAVRGL